MFAPQNRGSNPTPAALEVFLAVVTENGAGKAALALGMSQPAVSQHLRTLEEQLGQPLFERRGRTLVLTRYGQALLPEARRVLQSLENFSATARALGRSERGHVEYGASTTMAVYVLPKFLSKFHQGHPKVRMSCYSGKSERLIERLFRGEIEFAVVEGIEHVDGYRRHLFYEDELVVIVPPKHPWAKREEIPPSWLVKEPLIVREPGAVTWRVLERAFEHAGLELNPAIYTDNHEVTKRLVLEGAGVGIVSSVVVRPNLKVGNLKALRVKLKDGELRRIFWLVHPEQVGNPAAEALIKLLSS